MLNNLSEILKEGTTNFKVICHEWNKNNPNVGNSKGKIIIKRDTEK